MNRNILEIAKKCNLTEQNIEDMQPGFEDMIKMFLDKACKLADSTKDKNTLPSDAIRDYFGLDK